MGVLRDESEQRFLTGLAQQKFNLGGAQLTDADQIEVRSGQLKAQKLAKAESLKEARRAKFDADTLKEQNRSNTANELLRSQDLAETTRSNRQQELDARQKIAILQLQNDLAAAAAYDARRAAQDAAEAQKSTLQKIGSRIWSFFGF
jgi:hypothetical protein